MKNIDFIKGNIKMSKGLEALERIEDLLDRLYETDVIDDYHTHDISIIRKELKILEIIKEKVGIHWKNLLDLWLKTRLITQEEYDLLKVIKDED